MTSRARALSLLVLLVVVASLAVASRADAFTDEVYSGTTTADPIDVDVNTGYGSQPFLSVSVDIACAATSDVTTATTGLYWNEDGNNTITAGRLLAPVRTSALTRTGSTCYLTHWYETAGVRNFRFRLDRSVTTSSLTHIAISYPSEIEVVADSRLEVETYCYNAGLDEFEGCRYSPQVEIIDQPVQVTGEVDIGYVDDEAEIGIKDGGNSITVDTPGGFGGGGGGGGEGSGGNGCINEEEEAIPCNVYVTGGSADVSGSSIEFEGDTLDYLVLIAVGVFFTAGVCLFLTFAPDWSRGFRFWRS